MWMVFFFPNFRIIGRSYYRNGSKKLMKEIEHVIIPDEDQVAIYEFDTIRYTNKWMIGYHKSSDNII